MTSLSASSHHHDISMKSSYNSLLHSRIIPNESLDSKGNSFNQNYFAKSTSFTNESFQVNRVYLNKEFYQDYNRSYRD